jgi:hypothetical protein
MAAPYNPPKRGEDFKIRIGLEDTQNPGSFKANPTLAAGDFKIDKDGLDSGGSPGTSNLNTLPTVDPTGGTSVLIQLSATEMTADVVTVTAIDQTTPKEWGDFKLSIPTT